MAHLQIIEKAEAVHDASNTIRDQQDPIYMHNITTQDGQCANTALLRKACPIAIVLGGHNQSKTQTSGQLSRQCRTHLGAIWLTSFEIVTHGRGTASV